MKKRFTNTAIPAFSGAECWFQHYHIIQAIVKSNGWSEETAALQLFAHLQGEALDVALLLPKEKRESWPHLTQGLAAYYCSPGRLALLRRRFESAFRRPGLDPAMFATELGILALHCFEDMTEQARDIMIRDKFIAGQSQCTLRRQLDGLAPDTPIGEIVDSSRVWESHSEPEIVSESSHNCQETEWSGDFRTRERMKPVLDRQLRVSAIDEQRPEGRSEEDPSVLRSLLTQLLQLMQTEGLQEQSYQPLAAGPVCFSLSADGLVSEHGQWTIPSDTEGEDQLASFGGKREMVRAGGSASRTREDQSSTDPGGGFPAQTNGNPSGRCGT